MNQKIFALALGALLFALCSSAEAQQPKKIHRIGYLASLDPAGESARSEAIRLPLRDLGYIAQTPDRPSLPHIRVLERADKVIK